MIARTRVPPDEIRRRGRPDVGFVEVPYIPARVRGAGYVKFTATFMLGYGDPLQVLTPPVACP